MSLHGTLQNVKWPELVLTPKDGGAKLVGEKYGGTSVQRWIGKYKWDHQTQLYMVTVKNEDSGDFMAWTTDTKVVMRPSEYWWKLVFQEGKIGFQVPHHAGSDEAFRTVELDDNKLVVLKNQTGKLIDSQLWEAVE